MQLPLNLIRKSTSSESDTMVPALPAVFEQH